MVLGHKGQSEGPSSRHDRPDCVEPRWGRHLGPWNIQYFQGLSRLSFSALLVRCHSFATPLAIENGDQLGVGRELRVTHRHVNRGVVQPSLNLP